MTRLYMPRMRFAIVSHSQVSATLSSCRSLEAAALSDGGAVPLVLLKMARAYPVKVE